jgi:hypothetical protein
VRVLGSDPASADLASSAGRLTKDDLVADQALTSLDEDKLGHRHIAARIADLIATADTPTNIALFAPWGSGKSSFGGLLTDAFKSRGASIGVVTYDAWSYGGESLQRNFIGNAARQLGLNPDTEQGRPYFGGLYEGNRRVRFRLSWKQVFLVVALAALWLAAILLALIAVAAFVAISSQQDPVTAARSAVAAALPTAGVTGLLASLVTTLMSGARIDFEQGAPTQEQLQHAFARLVQTVTRSNMANGGFDRVLFFVDELDRCDKQSVVEVLRAIRGFFGEPNCLFLVAADRRVLEDALEALPQTTPVDIENPYYSSASEFFDKVFQFQFSLPPLRIGRLSGFARDLVRGREKGLWGTIGRSGDSPPLLDLVVHDLIPSHVRSPRRVKILLNNYAVNVRIAESRGIEWLLRAREIAKWTTLQTEFPRFAKDLVHEPRLPTLLLNPPEVTSPRLAELLERHRLPAALGAAQPAEHDDQLDSDVTATDATPDVPEEREGDLKIAQRRLLRAYLARVQDVGDPGRDLLFLAPAGDNIEFADPSFGQAIEDTAVDDVNAATAQIALHAPDEQRKAVRLLAIQAQAEFGPERLNVVSVMLRVASALEFALGDDLDEAIRILNVTHREEGLEPAHLLPALVIADQAGASGQVLSQSLIADDRLLATDAAVDSAARIAELLTAAHRRVVFEHLAERFSSSPDLLIDAFARLGPPAAAMLAEVSEEAITATVTDLEDEERTRALVVPLLDGVMSRSGSHSDALDTITLSVIAAENVFAYGMVKDRLEQITGILHADDGDWMVLRMLEQAPPADWDLLSSMLHADPGSKLEDLGAVATSTLRALLATAVSDASQVPLVAAVERMKPHLRLPTAKIWESAGEEIADALDTDVSSDRRQAQAELHRALLVLASVDRALGQHLEPLILNEIRRALAEEGSFEFGLAMARDVADDLSEDGRVALYQSFVSSQFAPGQASAITRTRARFAAVAVAAREKGAAKQRPAAGEVIAALAEEPGFLDILRNWLRSDPDGTELATVAASIARPTPFQEALTAWMRRATPAGRTAFIIRLIETSVGGAEAWAAFVSGAIDETRVYQAIQTRLKASKRGEERRRLARIVQRLRPRTEPARDLSAKIVTYLLDLNQKTDYESARIVLRALGPDVPHAGKVKSALRRATRAGLVLNSKWTRTLWAAGMPVPRDVKAK